MEATFVTTAESSQPSPSLLHAIRLHDIQDRTFALRNQAMDVLVALVAELRSARQSGSSDEQLRDARLMQRRGQFLLDFIEAENSMGFHAGGEAARVLAKSIDYLRQGQIALRDAAASRAGR